MSSIFAPTPAETTLVHQIFLQADPQKLGVVTGDAAVKIFDRAQLPPSLLADIWALADEENNGWLSKKGVAKAVRLIGWAQHGRKVAEDLLEKPGPLAKLEGINTVTSQGTGLSLSSNKSPLPPFPVLTPQDHDKYLAIFRRAGPVNGLLSGEKARDIFLKSKLPNDQLIQIWNLADTQDRGALDSADFAIGMFFINGLMSKTISFIPTSLPPGLYQQAGGGVASHLSGSTSGSFSPVHSSFSLQGRQTAPQSRVLQPNHTGMSVSSSNPSRAAPALPARPTPAAAVNSPFHQAPQSSTAWDVTPADKSNFDNFFDTLDTQKMGYIEGDVAVPFMLQSGLPGEVLATVWDLSDLNSDGRLTRDGFAVAMHLIQKKLAGAEIPATLPLSLIPPSMRPKVQVQAAPPPEPVKDLFSWDDSPPPSAVSPQQTGAFPTMQAQHTGTMSVLSAHATGARSPHNDPFASSVAATHTGSNRNFLDDDEPQATQASPPLQDKSAEIGNVKNQLSSTNRSLETTRAERVTLEQNLANQAAQLSSLQTQLSSAKASYETEVKLLSTLRDRHSTQLADMQKTREELIRAESDLSALKVEKAEIEGAFMRDKEDARELHRRMIETGQQADAIKAEVEKVKKDAKQQKGLLAIAKKQLSSKEAEKAKAEKDLQEAAAEMASITKEQEGVNASLAAFDAAVVPTFSAPAPAELAGSVDTVAFAAAQPLPATPDVGSPSVSIKSNNPFDRLKGGSTPRSQSPFAAFQSPGPQSEDVFNENIFMTRSDDGGHSVEGLPYESESKDLALNIANGNSLSVAREETASPVTANESELFHTPPTSARTPSLEAVTQFPAIDDFTAHFNQPQAAAPSAVAKTEKQAGGTSDFDSTFDSDVQPTKENQIEELESSLNPDNQVIKELDVNDSSESDSDSEDEDEVPLSQIKQNVVAAQDKEPAPAKEAERGGSFDDVFETSNSPEPTTEQEKKVDTKPDTFDDIFGAPAIPSSRTNGLGNSAKSPENGSAALANSSPFSTLKPAPAVPVTGVDAFDEALGKLSPNASAAPQLPQPQFSFDSAFEDNFDFAAAKADFTPAPTLPAATEQEPLTTTSTFDDIFANPTMSAALNGQVPPETPPFARPKSEVKTAAEATVPAVSFDDIFSGGVTSSAPAAETASASPKHQAPPPSQSPSVSGNPFPFASPASSPRPSSANRPASPLQERLPARAASPKPRLSASSSKDGEKKEPAVRHSKISLRLPFGRKKKQQHEPMPPPPTHLSPHPEQSERVATPAVEDDVESVKQLTSMGFSRTQAVLALEKHGYDVQLALNSLLAT